MWHVSFKTPHMFFAHHFFSNRNILHQKEVMMLLGRFCKPNFGSIFGRSVSDSAGPGMSSAEEVKLSFLFCKPKFLFLFGSIDREKLAIASSVGDLPHRDVPEDYREVESLLTPRPFNWPIAIANREDHTLNVFQRVSLPYHKRKSNTTRESNAPKDDPMVVCPADNKLFGLAVHDH